MKKADNTNPSILWKRRDFLKRLSAGLGLGLLAIPEWPLLGCSSTPSRQENGGSETVGDGGTKEAVARTEAPVSREPTAEASREAAREATQESPGRERLPDGSTTPEGGRLEPTPELPSHHEPVMEGRTCQRTEDNIEGPFYRQNAPWETKLAGSNEPGTPLQIEGVVMDQDCRPIANAIVDVWQANNKGSYDNDGQNDPPNNAFHLRGRMRTNAQGQYKYETIVPGRYLNGGTYRPGHIHYKVYAAGFQTLTTQLYFDGDPFIKGDPFVRPSLVIKLQGDSKGRRGVFPIVLRQSS